MKTIRLKTTRDGRWLQTVAAIALITAGGARASAQETAAADDDAAEEIVVTAQNREQRLQDVPISIQVVSGDTFREANIKSFEDFGPSIPNFSVTRSPAANVITMRGITSSPGSPSLEQSVVTFVDGIYGGNARQFAAPFLDIERMEVLRGPQGALVGRNTGAGAINIVTRKPGKEFGGYVNADYNFYYDGPTLEGAIDLPVSPNFALRFAGKYADLDGYFYNRLTDRDEPQKRDAVGRVTALLENGPLTITAKYEHADIKGDGTVLQVYSASRGRLFDYEKETQLTFSDEFDNLKTDLASLRADLEVGEHTITSITGYSHFLNQNRIDADFTEALGASADFDQDLDQWSQEVRLLSPTGQSVEYVVGAYYQKSDLLETRTTGVLFAPPASTLRYFDQDSEVVSLFGQLTGRLSDALRLVGGLRWTKETKDGSYQRFGGPNTYTDARTGTLQTQFSDKFTDNNLDPSVTVQYDASDQAMLYVSYGEGSKSGGFQGAISNAAPFSFQFAPETSSSIEAGAKITIPGVGYFNVAGYWSKYRNLQVSVSIPSPDGLSAPFFTGNAGDAKVRGIEAEGLARLGSGVELSGAAAWTPKANYAAYTAGPCFTGQVPNGSQPGSCDLSGARLAFAPKLSGSVTLRYEGDVSSALKLNTSLTSRFQSESAREFNLDPLNRQDGYMKLDARIGLGSVDDRYEFAIVGRNLTNKKTVGFFSQGGLAQTVFSPDARSLVMEPERSIAVQARIEF